MDIASIITFVHHYTTTPATVIFMGAALIFTWYTRCIQIRGIKKVIRFLPQQWSAVPGDSAGHTLSSVQAVFTALGTTIGIGNVVGPSIAIAMGGPGALFWLLLYVFFAAATRFVEVVFAIQTRITFSDGSLSGGPMRYLSAVSPVLGGWYAGCGLILFTSWSALQSNTLGCIVACDGVSPWFVAILSALFVAFVTSGSIQRIGMVASMLVPVACILYLLFALSIMVFNFSGVIDAFKLIFFDAFTPAAAVAGFVGASVFKSFGAGVSKAIFITEAGLGTGAIAHALADTKKAKNQALLAMYSMIVDGVLCLISGLLALSTGVWRSGNFDSALAYKVFKAQAPYGGDKIFLMSVILLVVTTLLGNTFNGRQMYCYMTNNRGLFLYTVASSVLVFAGVWCSPPLLWASMDIVLSLVAIPHVIALVMLFFRLPQQWRA